MDCNNSTHTVIGCGECECIDSGARGEWCCQEETWGSSTCSSSSFSCFPSNFLCHNILWLLRTWRRHGGMLGAHDKLKIALCMCVGVGGCACVHACVSVRTCMGECACMHAWVWVHACVSVGACMLERAYMHVCMYILTFIYLYIVYRA